MMGLRSGDPTVFIDLHAFVALTSRRDRDIGQSTYVLFVFFVVNPFGTSENAKSTQVGEVVQRFSSLARDHRALRVTRQWND